MMALSFLNIPATSPAAPVAPPGVAPANGAFDLPLPIADPADPRHEPAPDGKQLGKDLPVDETETPNPLAWLTPPVTPPVSPTAPPRLPQAPAPAAEPPIAIAPGKRPVSRPVQTAASESEPALAITSSPAPLPTAQPVTPGAMNETDVIRPLTPAVSPQLPTISADLPITLTPDTPPRAILTEAPIAMLSITREVSRPLPAPAGEAPIAPIVATPAAMPVQVAVSAPATPIVITTPPPVAAEPAPLRPVDAPSPRDPRGLPRPVSRQEPGVALEPRPAPLALTPTPRIAPAALVFADAIHRAVHDDRGPATPEAAALTALSDIKTQAIAATADAQHGALDLRQAQWPARMIERIEALRDAANANDTSIRLIPDALGKIDVSLKRDGDTVAVHFAAQQPETRQLLADAAPKLAELAEARGLKLAQNGADTAGQQQPRQQPVAQAFTTPRRADADDTDSTDTRIA